jgi:hypothetical protein
MRQPIWQTKGVAIDLTDRKCGNSLILTLNLTAVGRFAHTIFKGLFLKKSLSAKNRQKIPNPQKTSAESNSWVVNPSKNVNLCPFMPQNRTKPEKCVKQYGLSVTAAAFSPTSRWGGVGWQWGVGGKPLNRAKVRSRQKCGRLFADCRPHRPLSTFCLK